MKRKLKDYLYVDQHRIQALTDQLRERFTEEENHKWSLTASLTGPRLQSGRSRTRRELNLHERIEILTQHLEESGDLRRGRPQSITDVGGPGAPYGPRYVFEHTDAAKLIVPTQALTPVRGLSSLAVWISDPDFTLRPANQWDYVGTFLYLVEAHWDTSPFHTTYSGCSALQAIVNTIRGDPFLAHSPCPTGPDGYAVREFWEPFGRGSTDHPIRKLQRLEATISDTRRIATLYRLRYMTNEQCCVGNGEERRVNDILGYPVYIASAP